MEDHQTKTEHVKEEVLDTEFVEVDSQDVHQLCTACLCATRTTRTLDDDALKQYYMHILTEMQPEGGVVLQSLRVCWECVSHLKRSVRFREQVQDSYRLLQPMLSMCDKEDQEEFLETLVWVCRPGRLNTCFTHSIDIPPQDDDEQLMAVTKHDDDDEAAWESFDNHIERLSPTVDEAVARFSEVKSEDCAAVLGADDKQSDHKLSILQHDEEFVVCPTVDGDILKNKKSRKTSSGKKCKETNSVQNNKKTKVKNDKQTNYVKLYQCKMCQISFSAKAEFVKHKRSHKSFQCEVCHKSFADRWYLEIHMTTHTGKKRFQCETCHKSFSQLSNLGKHSRTHTGEKPHMCEMCNKSFALKHHLVRHLRIHTGEKPFQCEKCHKSFSRKHHVLGHLRIHSGEKPFQCVVCLKSFKLKSNLTSHLRTHTGEKRFQCEVCQRYFAEKFCLLRHKKENCHGQARL